MYRLFAYGGVYERAVNNSTSGSGGPGLSLARRVVYLDKELNSTLSSPRCINWYRRQTGDGLASRPWGRGGNTPRHASCEGNRDKLQPFGLLTRVRLFYPTFACYKFELDQKIL